MEENTAPAGDNEALLQELVLRLLTHPADPRTQNPRLLVGQLPDALPVELPLPAESRLFGSLQRSASHAEVIFDTPLPEQEVLAFYRERLPAAGWQEDESFPGMRQGGFVHTRLGIGALSQWYQGTRGPTLHVQAFSGQGGRTDVRLNLDLSGRNSPAQRARMHRRHMMGHDFLPPLLAPAGATQMGGGGGGGGESYYSSATLETTADLTTLIAHYAGQLEQAGWTRTDEGQSGPLAWHAWTFQDEDGEPWRAVFFMLKMPGTEDQYSLYMRADWANKGGTSGAGGFSWAPMSSIR
jgi:hypothetical protein